MAHSQVCYVRRLQTAVLCQLDTFWMFHLLTNYDHPQAAWSCGDDTVKEVEFFIAGSVAPYSFLVMPDDELLQ